ncbi:MAG: hypothetical protein VKS61_18795 [Candidatus Sericytochromatia bacterium]|nr:hypothetical protein [Candidatus Sericytochromatia bacterium]
MQLSFSRLLSLGLAAAMLAGCGALTPAARLRQADGLSARSVAGLEEGFNLIYGAAFARADANGDLNVDEFEAGPFIDVRDFRQADDDRNARLSEKEFRAWATRGWLFGLFAQDQKTFVRQQRRTLLGHFQKLDTDRSGLLAPAELADAALLAARIRLDLKGIKTAVQVDSIDELDLKQADKTGDGQLSQGEFEDFILSAWARRINPPRQPAAN